MILLSHIIDNETPTYGNRDCLTIIESSSIKEGSSANSSKWIFSTNHLGTHIDVPKHFFESGKTITDFSLDFWISDKVQIIDIPCMTAKLIEVDHVSEEINIETEFLLIRTGYEKYRHNDKYWNDNPGLSANVGFWLRLNYPKIRMIGFDFISLTSWIYREEGKQAHKAFLNPEGIGSPICIIEDMALSGIKSTLTKMIVSPLFCRSSNGSPVTVFAC